MDISKRYDIKIVGNIYSIASGSNDDYLESLRQGFEPHMVRLFDSLISNGDYFLDVWANIGVTSILFGQISNQVFSFEPSPRTFACLHRNIANSGLPNMKVLNYRLGWEFGISDLFQLSSWGLGLKQDGRIYGS
jgi:hypothetical protein